MGAADGLGCRLLARWHAVGDHQQARWSLAALSITFELWSIAWVRSGKSLQAAVWPFVDVLLLNGLVLSGLLLRQCLVWRPEKFDRLPAAMALGMVASIPALLLFWGVFGNSRWQTRLAGVAVGLAIAWYIPIAVWHNRYAAWDHLVCATILLVCLSLEFAIARFRGVRLTHAGAASDSIADQRSGRRQFRLTDLLLWVSVASVLCGETKFTAPLMPPRTQWWPLTTMGATLAIVSIASVWAAFGKTAAWLRISAWTVIVLTCGLFDHLLFGRVTQLAWWWPVGLHASLAASMAASLAVFRVHGFRLGRKA